MGRNIYGGKNIMEDRTTKETIYDQKSFIQIRIHELFLKIDKANSNPFYFNYPMLGRIREEDNLYNYQVTFNGLCSVLSTIRAKLSIKERELMETKRKELMQVIDESFIDRARDALGNFCSRPNIELKEKIINGLFEFRGLVEDAMNVHGFNPDKDDVGKSIIKM